MPISYHNLKKKTKKKLPQFHVFIFLFIHSFIHLFIYLSFFFFFFFFGGGGGGGGGVLTKVQKRYQDENVETKSHAITIYWVPIKCYFGGKNNLENVGCYAPIYNGNSKYQSCARHSNYYTSNTNIGSTESLSYGRLLVKTSTNRNVDNQNVDKPKRRQTETSTNQNVDKPKRRQTKTSTDRNVDKPKRRQTKTSTNQNVDTPKPLHNS